MKLLKEILSDFIQVEVLRHSDPFEVDIHQPRNRVPIEHVYLDVLATATLTECFNSYPAGVRQVQQSCLYFMVELVE